MKNICNLSF